VAALLDRAIVGKEVPSPLKIGYAGCALGTSEPLLKDIAVVKMNDVYDIYVGGEAKGIKAPSRPIIRFGHSGGSDYSPRHTFNCGFSRAGKKERKIFEIC
jgi:hypothetical protein